MPDLLVNLLNLPDLESFVDGLNHVGVGIRHAQPFEIHAHWREFIKNNFSVSWGR